MVELGKRLSKGVSDLPHAPCKVQGPSGPCFFPGLFRDLHKEHLSYHNNNASIDHLVSPSLQTCALTLVALVFGPTKMPRSLILAVLTALLAVVNANGLYSKKSPVLQVDAKSYDSLIAQSNHTTVSIPT